MLNKSVVFNEFYHNLERLYYKIRSIGLIDYDY